MRSPEYRPDRGRPLGYLDVSATFDPRSRSVFLNVLNRSEKLDLSTRIDNVEGQLASSASLWLLSHSDLKAVHGFGGDRKVRPITRTEVLPVKGSSFTFTFPRHSLSILKLTLR